MQRRMGFDAVVLAGRGGAVQSSAEEVLHEVHSGTQRRRQSAGASRRLRSRPRARQLLFALRPPLERMLDIVLYLVHHCAIDVVIREEK